MANSPPIVPHGANTPTNFEGPQTTPFRQQDTAATDAEAWYTAYFARYGLPPDVQAQIIQFLTQYAGNPTLAIELAQQYLTTTPWFQQTYPGYSQGASNGIYGDLTGYTSYVNAVNQLYNQYYGRPVSGDEISGFLSSGYSPNYIGQLLQGQAWVGANRRDVQYETGAFAPGGHSQRTGKQLEALGNETAGIDSFQGQLQAKVLQKAQQVMGKIFTGSYSTPTLSLGGQGLFSPSLEGRTGPPDVAA